MNKSDVFLRQPPEAGATRLWDWLLGALILAGIAMRFLWVDWHQGTNLHPDEYGLTNTLTRLQMPANPAEYFNTRLSLLSPYHKYDLQGNVTANGPDQGMRWGQWPQILLRWAAEITGNTGYDELRVMGRRISALADSLSLLLLYLTGRRLYSQRVALLATALSALAVMQIQQSHFMTVDNFSVLFTSAALYCAVRAAQAGGRVMNPGNFPQVPAVKRGEAQDPPGEPDGKVYSKPAGGSALPLEFLVWSAFFGIAFGMAAASRINLLPLGGMILAAAFLQVTGLKPKSRGELLRVATGAAISLAVAFLAAALAFRVTQPMSFRNPGGDTTLLTLQLNPDWVNNMRQSMEESRGIGGGPPQEQWAHRTPIVFPWVNMVVWGMGLPLGLAAWLGFLWAAWRSARYRAAWRLHLLPLVWVGGLFLFMGTRWAFSMRYFLPIYPFLCLLAAWLLESLRQGKWVEETEGLVRQNPVDPRPKLSAWAGILLTWVVLAGTLAWAWAFSGAVYRQDHTRIRASQWIYENVPASFQLSIQTAEGERHQPVTGQDEVRISSFAPYERTFVAGVSGKITAVTVPHAAVEGVGGQSHLRIILEGEGQQPVGVATLAVENAGQNGEAGSNYTAEFDQGDLVAGQTYTLLVSQVSGEPVRISRAVLSNENWDEGLPLSLPGSLSSEQGYRFLEMKVRWYDNEEKRQMFLANLAQVEYILLPSQRGIWSTCRLPRTYPMTIEYYRALFDGRLGFDLAATFSAIWRLGPLAISDVGGSAAWGRDPDLPVFNNRLLAAEEAFSVYDHPPVWIFKKRADFSLETARRILEAIDLSQAVVQAPVEADGPPCTP